MVKVTHAVSMVMVDQMNPGPDNTNGKATIPEPINVPITIMTQPINLPILMFIYKLPLWQILNVSWIVIQFFVNQNFYIKL